MDRAFESLTTTVTRLRDHITELDGLLQAYQQAQLARRESEERFQLLVESVQDYAIFLLDPEGFIESWNRGAERIKGYTPEEIIGHHFSRFYPREALQADLPAQQLVTVRRDGRWEGEGWRIRKDGSRFWANVIITALYDRDGTLRGFAKVTRDLTERKRAEEALAAAVEREHAARIMAEQTAEQLRQLQQVTDAALVHLTVDDLLNELLKRVRAVLNADTATILLLDESGTMLCVRAALGLEAEVEQSVMIPVGWGIAGRIAATKQALIVPDLSQEEVVSPILRSNGICSLVGAPLLHEGQVIGVIHVGTLQPRLFTDHELALLQRVADRCGLAIVSAMRYTAEHEARQAAETALQVRDTFLSVASHELKTPLTSLLLSLDLLWRRTNASQSLPDRDRRTLEKIREQGQRLDRLVAQLLDLSRIEAGGFRLECAPLDLAAVIDQVVTEIGTALETHTIVTQGLDTPLMIEGDSGRLSQVVYNLLANAIKYSPHGGQIEIWLDRQPAQASIIVRDEGIGIPPEALPHLFERFYRAPNVDPRAISGMGLGLFIIQEIVTQHGGTVTVTSQEGKGSTFTVCLPLSA